MRIKEAIQALESEGFDLSKDKVVFKLKDGALEIYVDEESKTIKTEIHDMQVFTSDDLKDKEMMDVLYDISGIQKEDE
ncbi:hypothetical protein [Mammaliicoccus lentus]|uniref:hypothetical protein n=1 Tax=Mammaliicoccus lentus TaxID=42858 RepID=UPI001C4F255C|nr:hypothetical protein [Mammaliicoccus lentus]MBW0761374.1 hypothetical protein [Mammaliicoccus lentus]